jgi:hypothetical protein
VKKITGYSGKAELHLAILTRNSVSPSRIQEWIYLLYFDECVSIHHIDITPSCRVSMPFGFFGDHFLESYSCAS